MQMYSKEHPGSTDTLAYIEILPVGEVDLEEMRGKTQEKFSINCKNWIIGYASI